MTRLPTDLSGRSLPTIRVPDGRIGAPTLGAVNLRPIAERDFGSVLGPALQQLAEPIEMLGQQMVTARRARELTALQGEFTTGVFEAQEKARQADPTDAVSVYDDEIGRLRSRLAEYSDPAVQSGGDSILTRLAASGTIAVRRDAINRSNGLAVAGLVEQSQSLLSNVQNGDLTAESAIALLSDSSMRHVGTAIDIKGQREFVAQFAVTAIRNEYHGLLDETPELAAMAMESEDAAKYLPADERARRIDAAKDEVDRQNAVEAQAAFDEAQRAIDEQLNGTSFPSAGVLQTAIEGRVEFLHAHPGAKVKGAFGQPKQLTKADLRQLLLEDAMRAQADRGDAGRFAIIEQSMPRTSRARAFVEQERRTLQAAKGRVDSAVFFEAKKSELFGAAARVMMSAEHSHGASIITDAEVAMPDGTTRRVTREEILRETVPKLLTDIAKAHEGDEDRGFVEQVKFLSRNGVTHEVWSNMMRAGWTALTQDITKDPEGKPVLPANLESGYDLYRRLGAVNPKLRDLHITDENVRRFYEGAAILEKWEVPGDSAQALVLSAIAQNETGAFPNPLANSITRKQFEANVEEATGFGFWDREPKNIGLVKGNVEQLARAYMQIYRLGPEQAVEAAAEKIHNSYSLLNGWAVDTGNAHVPQALDQITTIIAEEYVKRFGDDEGLDVDDLTLVPGETPESWMLVNATVGGGTVPIPVEQYPRIGRYTNADLLDAFNGHLQFARDEAIRIVVDGDLLKHRAFVIDPVTDAQIREAERTGVIENLGDVIFRPTPRYFDDTVNIPKR